MGLKSNRRLVQSYRRMQESVLGASSYVEKVLSRSPIAYWTLGEANGSVAYCQVNSAQNGVHSGVLLGQTGIGDGGTAAYYDGSAYTDLYTVIFRDAFSGPEGSALCWVKIAAAQWVDGTARNPVSFFASGNDNVQFIKASANNRFSPWYESGNVIKEWDIGTSTTDWIFVILTWSEAAQEAKSYYNGLQFLPTRVNAESWIGDLSINETNVGCLNRSILSRPFIGHVAHVAVFDTILSAIDAVDLYVI